MADLSRVEAAAYLTTKGYRMKPSTLAKYATTDGGPKFTKTDKNRVHYSQEDLDAWAQAHPPGTTHAPYNRQPKRNGHEEERMGAPTKALSVAALELASLAEMLIRGQGAMLEGARLVVAIETVKRLVRR
jgi:hypothetical protein